MPSQPCVRSCRVLVVKGDTVVFQSLRPVAVPKNQLAFQVDHQAAEAAAAVGAAYLLEQ